MKPEDRWFYRGMACAAAVIARRDEPTLAVECLEQNGVTLAMLRQARVEPFDLGPIAKAWKSERPRRTFPRPTTRDPRRHQCGNCVEFVGVGQSCRKGYPQANPGDKSCGTHWRWVGAGRQDGKREAPNSAPSGADTKETSDG